MTDNKENCRDCPETEPVIPNDGRILITGAGGFVGRKLCEALAGRGYKLRVLVRNDRHEQLFRSLQAQIYTGDIRDREVVDWACDGVTGVFHLASIVQQAGIHDNEFWDTHVTAVKQLLVSAKKYGIVRVVHCSTIGVLGHITGEPADESMEYNVEDIYQITKAEGEKVALEFYALTGFPITVVRPAAVYGPGDTRLLKLFKLVATGKFRMVGSGNTLIHPVYIDDLVDGMILAYEKENAIGEKYILGGKEPVSLSQWVDIIAAHAGVKRKKLSVPYSLVRFAAIACEAVCKPLNIEPPLFRRRVDFFVKNRAFSIDKARTELGYEPKVDLNEGSKLALEWYKKEGWIP